MADTTVVVFVPGYTGSTLVNPAGDVVWPLAGPEIAQLLNPSVTLLPSGLLSPYDPLVDFFQGNGFMPAEVEYSYEDNNSSFSPRDINLPTDAAKILVTMPYDWRRSNDLHSTADPDLNSAAQLLNVVEKIDEELASSYDLYLVGHSMGGLVCRSVLEIRPLDTTRGWGSHLQSLITLATPHLGAPEALAAAIGQANLSKSILGAELADVVAQAIINDTPLALPHSPLYPSGYELMPYYVKQSESWKCICNQDQGCADSGPGWTDIETSKRDLEAHGLIDDYWNEAKTFFGHLNYGTPKVPYHCLYSTAYDDTSSRTGREDTKTCYGLQDSSGSVSPLTAAGNGDGFVPPFSGSFGQDPTSQDGSTTFVLPNVNAYSFSGFDHIAMATSDVPLTKALSIIQGSND